MEKSFLVTNMRTRTLPSENACRVKADGMGSPLSLGFPLQDMFGVLDFEALSM